MLLDRYNDNDVIKVNGATDDFAEKVCTNDAGMYGANDAIEGL